MLKVKQLNISSSTLINYSTRQRTDALNIAQISYLNYNSGEKLIGGCDSYNSGYGYTVHYLPLAYSFRNVSSSYNWLYLGSGSTDRWFFVPIYHYDTDIDEWIADDDVYAVTDIYIGGAKTYVGYKLSYINFTEDRPFESIYREVTLYTYGNNDRNVILPTTIKGTTLNIRSGQPYSKSELDAQIDARFTTYPNIRQTIKAQNNYGGVIVTRNNMLEYLNNSIWERSTTRGGDTRYSYRQAVWAEGQGFYNPISVMSYRTNPTCILLFRTEEEYRAAMCVYTQWPQAPYYPIS